MGMKSPRIQTKILAAIIGSLILCSTLYTLLAYQSRKADLIAGVDAQLMAVNTMATELFGPDYHGRIADKTSVSAKEFDAIVARNDSLCRELGLEYIWSVMVLDGKIVFTTATHTDKNDSASDCATFLQVHSNPDAYVGAFKTMLPEHKIISDKWGDIRVVLTPHRDSRGRPFLVGSGIKLSTLGAMLRWTIIESAAIGIAVAFLGSIGAYVVARSISKPLVSLTQASRQLAAGEIDIQLPSGGSAELVTLAESFDTMQKAIRSQMDHLRASREDLHVTLDSIGDAVLATDAEGNIVRMNPVAAELTGWSVDEVTGRGLTEVFRIADQRIDSDMASLVDTVVKTGRLTDVSADMLLVARDASQRRIAHSAAPIRDAAGLVVGLVLVFRDISREYALQMERKRLSDILEATSDLVAMASPDGRLSYVNPAGRRLLGLPDDLDLTDKMVSDCHSESAFSILRDEAIPTAIAEGRWVGETLLLSASGREIPVSQIIMSHKSGDGELYLSSIMRDMSERNELEDQLRQSQKMDAVGQLAGGVAHDFNNLLTGIMGNAQLLAMDMGPDSSQKGLTDAIVDASSRAADLTQQLLAFSRKGKLQTISIDVNQIISNDVIGLLARSIDKSIEIVSKLDACPSVIDGDPTQLQSAILNMGLNARDAMAVGGVLTFATRNVMIDDAVSYGGEIKPGEYVEIEVSDTGIGMDAETQKRMYEPFFTTKEVGKGTGLGLAGVFACVHSHHGLIRVYSEVGVGSTFTVLLPQSESAVDVRPVADDELRRGEGHVLVVDDEEILRNVSARILQGLGYTVTTCKDGLEAIGFVQSHEGVVDVVLLDLVMPKISGQETFRKLKEIDPDICVLVASGFARADVISSIIAEGALGFLAKPYRIEELSQEIAGGIRKNHAAGAKHVRGNES